MTTEKNVEIVEEVQRGICCFCGDIDEELTSFSDGDICFWCANDLGLDVETDEGEFNDDDY
jgi:hypothetical protein